MISLPVFILMPGIREIRAYFRRILRDRKRKPRKVIYIYRYML